MSIAGNLTLAKLFTKSSTTLPISITDTASSKLIRNITNDLRHTPDVECDVNCTYANSREEHEHKTQNQGFGFKMLGSKLQAGKYMIMGLKHKTIESRGQGTRSRSIGNYVGCNILCEDKSSLNHSKKCTNIDFELENGSVANYSSSPVMCKDEFHLADSNKDGVLTQDEFHDSPELFSALDINDDGHLTLPEATETPHHPDPYHHVHADTVGDSYVHSHEGVSDQHTHTDTDDCINNGKSGKYIISDEGKTNYCCTSNDASGCKDFEAVCWVSTAKNPGGDGPNNCLSGRNFPDCSGSSPPQPGTIRYRGINLTAYDNGNLSGQAGDRTTSGAGGTEGLDCPDINICGKGLCTDDTYDTGGWSESFSINPSPSYGRAVEFIAGNVSDMWSDKVKSSPIADTLGNSDKYTYATVYPPVSQIDAAIKAGVNIFRLPFMPTFINEMATGWAENVIMQEGGPPSEAILYVPPSKNYLNYYMTTLNYIITQNPHVKVIMDCHVYQRWCPMNIPGTQACLEGGGGGDTNPSPPRKYSNDAIADSMCPYAVYPANLERLKNILAPINHADWDSVTGNPSANSTITKDNIGNFNSKGNFCKGVINKSNSTVDTRGGVDYLLDISSCKSDVSGDGNDANKCYGPPTKRILGPDCTVVMWYNILQSTFTLVDKKGDDLGNKMSVEDYFNQTNSSTLQLNSDSVWIGLMNEPNEVETGELAKTYGALFVLFRQLGLENKLLVEGNSWAGLHAQCDPVTRGLWYSTDTDAVVARAKELRDYASGTKIAEAWKYGEMAELTAISGSDASLNKYFDLNDPTCKNYPCEIIWQGINKALAAAHPPLPTLDGKETNWIYDVHQYMDINSTGIQTCPSSDVSSEQIYNVEEMKRFTNFNPFIQWARSKNNPVKIFVSEFGVQIDPTYRCNNRLNLFIKMIEDPKYNDVIMGWTIWRAPPPVKWLVRNNTPVVSWTNAIIFGPEDALEAPYTIIYNTVAPFTTIPQNPSTTNANNYDVDEDRKQFCMPALWNLKGTVAKSGFNWNYYVPENGWVEK